MGDDEILQLFYHRVEYAISAVEEKYGRLCRSVARGILKDERDVEECVNDTCMRAWNAIPPEKPRSLEAYLVRITRNLALDRYAYHHSQKRETALTEAYEELEACLPLGSTSDHSKAHIEGPKHPQDSDSTSLSSNASIWSIIAGVAGAITLAAGAMSAHVPQIRALAKQFGIPLPF